MSNMSDLSNTCHWYHFSRKEISHFYDVEQNNKGFPHKPNGLWLSYNNEWAEWLNNPDNPNDKNSAYNGFKYETKLTDLNLIKITTLQELNDFIYKYSIKIYVESKYIGLSQIDWEAVSKVCDGIMILNYHSINYQLFKLDDLVKRDYFWFHVLDINCCYIWNASKIKSFKLSQMWYK